MSTEGGAPSAEGSSSTTTTPMAVEETTIHLGSDCYADPTISYWPNGITGRTLSRVIGATEVVSPSPHPCTSRRGRRFPSKTAAPASLRRRARFVPKIDLVAEHVLGLFVQLSRVCVDCFEVLSVVLAPGFGGFGHYSLPPSILGAQEVQVGLARRTGVNDGRQVSSR